MGLALHMLQFISFVHLRKILTSYYMDFEIFLLHRHQGKARIR